jgi:hypothetical protein
LEDENQDGGGQANAGQNFDHPRVGFFFFLLIFRLEARGL